MTANQVAFAVTNEQSRHNLKSEELQKLSLDIENAKVEYQRDYQQRDLSLKEQYNNAYLNYLKADQSEKARYQQTLNDIDAEKVANDAYYKQLALALDKQKANAQKEYWQASAEVASRNADIYARKVDYDASYQQAAISNWLSQNWLNQAKLNADYSLGLMDQQNKLFSNQISLMDTQQKRRYYNAKALQAAASSLRDITSAAMTATQGLLLGGIK